MEDKIAAIIIGVMIMSLIITFTYYILTKEPKRK